MLSHRSVSNATPNSARGEVAGDDQFEPLSPGAASANHPFFMSNSRCIILLTLLFQVYTLGLHSNTVAPVEVFPLPSQQTDLRNGDKVFWVNEDIEIPAGTRGTVLRAHKPSNGRGEMSYDVRFESSSSALKTWNFKASELTLPSTRATLLDRADLIRIMLLFGAGMVITTLSVVMSKSPPSAGTLFGNAATNALFVAHYCQRGELFPALCTATLGATSLRLGFTAPVIRYEGNRRRFK